MELHQIDINLNEKITFEVDNSKIVIIKTPEEPEQPKAVEEPPVEEVVPVVEKIVPVIEIPKLPVTGM